MVFYLANENHVLKKLLALNISKSSGPDSFHPIATVNCDLLKCFNCGILPQDCKKLMTCHPHL